MDDKHGRITQRGSNGQWYAPVGSIFAVHNAQGNLRYEGSTIDRLADFEDAEEQGRLVLLPCKVKDCIYGFRRFINKPWDIYESKIQGFYIGKKGITIRSSRCYAITPDDIDGVNLFLTREEAEAALAERMKDNENNL